MSAAESAFTLQPAGYDDLPGWGEDDPSPLFSALGACRRHVREVKPYRAGTLGLTTEDLLPLLDAAATAAPGNAAEARAFFESRCTPFRICRDGGHRGFVTAFYEPEIQVSATPGGEWRFPFYRRPDDLIDLDAGNRPDFLDASYAFGRMQDGRIGAYQIAAKSIAAISMGAGWKSPGRNRRSTCSSRMCRARRGCAIPMAA